MSERISYSKYKNDPAPARTDCVAALSLCKLTSIINSSPSCVWTPVTAEETLNKIALGRRGRRTCPVVMFIYEGTDIFIVISAELEKWRGQSNRLVLCCICGQFIANLESDPCPATQIILYLTTAGSYIIKYSKATSLRGYFANNN